MPDPQLHTRPDVQPGSVPRTRPGTPLNTPSNMQKETVMKTWIRTLAPILMTALTTGLALVPLVITGNKPGQEIEYPMAFVILGGLVTSTLLNLLVLPPLFARFGYVPLPSEGENNRHAEDVSGESDQGKFA